MSTENYYFWGGSAPFNSSTNNTANVNYVYNVPAPLFGNWLKATDQLQKEYFGNDLAAMEGKQREAEVILQAYAATEEIHEATAEVSWKPWAKSEFFNREAYIGELVDALHFSANMLCIAGCTDAELTAAYEEKMERNRERQRNNYTGLDKCESCRRAVDDLIAHGTDVFETVDGNPICQECIDGD